MSQTTKTLLRLGRVSNLPTVWTNTLAGGMLAHEDADRLPLALAGLCASLLYTGGMFLNDYFDRHGDTQNQPERPIPAGAIGAGRVAVLGFGQLALGLGGLWALVGWQTGTVLHPASGYALALAGLIVVYDVFHKKNPASPFLMAGCRALLYLTGGALVGGEDPAARLYAGAAGLFSYVVLLSALAKRENAGYPVPVPGGIAALIAGMCLYDAALVALTGRFGVALVLALGFPLTRRWQRRVRGT